MHAETRDHALWPRGAAYFTLAACIVSACVMQKNEWQDLDYSSVYRHYKQREYDTGYIPPRMGCMDEDLYNCK